MTEAEVHGPIDFVLIEFSGDRLTGGAGQALLDLVDRGIVAVYDVLVLGKSDDGTVYAVDLEESAEQIGGFGALAWVRSGLLTEDDMREAAGALEPGKLAVLIVYENTWAVPFVAAARGAGGELIAGTRIPAPEVMAPWMTWTRGSPPQRRREESTCHYFAGSRTAVVAGTASAVSGRVRRRQQRKWAAQEAPPDPDTDGATRRRLPGDGRTPGA
jgi:hypothetical protein